MKDHNQVINKPQSIVTFLLQEIEKQRKSLFLWSPVAMGAGIICYFHTSIEIPWLALISILPVLVLLIWKTSQRYRNIGSTISMINFLFSISLSLFVLGFLSSQYRTQSLSTNVLEKDMIAVTIHANIEKLSIIEKGKAKRVILNNILIQDEDRQNIKLDRVRLKTYHFKGDTWKNGDKVEIRATLKAPSKPVMPGGFDFSFKAYYDNLSAVGYTIGNAVLIEQANVKTSYIQSFRNIISKQTYKHMDDRYAGIAQALLTGERSGIKKQDTEYLRTSGLAHLLAISGLHIGLVAGCVFFFIRLFLVLIPGLALKYPIKKWAAAIAIIIVFSYMILAGATVPTVRAFIMTSLVLLAVILDRSALNMRLVALAALIIMITTPEAIMGPSFVLSFAAVSALIMFYQTLGQKWFITAKAYTSMWRPIYYLIGIIATTLIATFATMPFTIMFFNRFATYSILSNFMAMPLMGFIVMPFGLISVLAMPFGFDGHLWKIMEWGIENIILIAQSISNYEQANIYMPSFDLSDTILISIGFIWAILWRGYLKAIGIVLIIVTITLSTLKPIKRIIISQDMKAVLFVDTSVDNLFLIGKMSGYLKRNWIGSLGYNPLVDIPSYKTMYEVDKSIYCDDLSCKMLINDINISIIINPMAIDNECKTADIIISKIPIKNRKRCQNAHIIDRFDVWRHGATTIDFINDKNYKIRTVK